MNKTLKRHQVSWIRTLALGGTIMLMATGCGKTRETADTVADEITGKRAIDQGDHMKSQLRQIDALKSGQLQDLQGNANRATDENDSAS